MYTCGILVVYSGEVGGPGCSPREIFSLRPHQVLSEAISDPLKQFVSEYSTQISLLPLCMCAIARIKISRGKGRYPL